MIRRPWAIQANVTHTCDDADFDIPEVADFTGSEVGRYARKPGEGLDISADFAPIRSVVSLQSDQSFRRFPITRP